MAASTKCKSYHGHKETGKEIMEYKMHWACDNDLLDYFGSSDEDVTILKKFEQSTKSSLKSILLCVRGWHKLLLKFRLNETEINYILHDPNRVQELRAAETVAHIVDVI